MRNDVKMKSWPGSTVARLEKYTGKMFIEGVEVIFDPVWDVYIPKEKRKNVNRYDEVTVYDV